MNRGRDGFDFLLFIDGFGSCMDMLLFLKEKGWVWIMLIVLKCVLVEVYDLMVDGLRWIYLEYIYNKKYVGVYLLCFCLIVVWKCGFCGSLGWYRFGR